MASTASLKTKNKNPKVARQLKQGLDALSRHDYAIAAAKLQKVVDQDKTIPLAWRMLAYAYEKQSDFVKAFEAYEVAARLEPDNISLLRSVGELAYRMDRFDLSEKLLVRFLAEQPDDEVAINALACTYREQNRYGDAVDLLRDALSKNPERAGLWNILGSVMTDSGETASSITFYDEALRLAPHFQQARYNRAQGLSLMGDYKRALEELDIAANALSDPKEVANITLSKAFVQLLSGDLVGGFESYEARLDWSSQGAMFFGEYGARWQVNDDLKGKKLLIYAEQGLGDEILFSNLIKDVLEALGPDGGLYLAVEPRLVSLFQRSFPTAHVKPNRIRRQIEKVTWDVNLGEHASQIDLWVPMASLFRQFRTKLEDFPKATSFLIPDPERVAHWRRLLEASGPGPYVGVLWKSIKATGSRQRHYSPFDLWEPVLKCPNTQFVNLQYGDAAQELAEAKERGFDIWSMPDIDLKMDIDDLAALCAAMDVVIGPSTATTNISAAVGTKTWILAGPGWWTGFGSDYAPCYPTARVFHAGDFHVWDKVMKRVAQALGEEVSAGNLAHAAA